jgi:hypothetical protein
MATGLNDWEQSVGVYREIPFDWNWPAATLLVGALEKEDLVEYTSGAGWILQIAIGILGQHHDANTSILYQYIDGVATPKWSRSIDKMAEALVRGHNITVATPLGGVGIWDNENYYYGVYTNMYQRFEEGYKIAIQNGDGANSMSAAYAVVHKMEI